MRNVYNEQLRMLHQNMTEMGAQCETAVSLAVQAVTLGSEELAARVFEVDAGIDKMERDIESLCLKLLLKQQPVASDLRDISSALKMISDLERIGDQASDIADLYRYTSGAVDKTSADLREMAQESVKMVNESIDAFVRRDLVMAREVIAYDDVVDRWFERIKTDLIAAISADNTKGEYYLDLLMVAKYLERIGDHATNIAEWVEYSILGKRSKDGVFPDEEQN
ncbi:MAG: phosphate signaling complex protein PhoU [Oscillospiraceae bacterium]|nr:phosphate signaling complex protein PhoU [Oscillospiraceae bacterium]